MASRFLLKLIDEAILPAVLLIASKIIALCLINYFAHYQCEVQFVAGKVFPTIVYFSSTQAVSANSYSNLATYISIFLGFFWIVIRSIQFHDSHVTPKMTAKLAQWNLLSLLANSFTLYHRAGVWVVFLWVSTGINVVYAFMGLAFWWVAVLSVILSLAVTYLLLEDIEGEINARRYLRNGLS